MPVTSLRRTSMRQVPLAPLELTNVPVFLRSPLYTCAFELSRIVTVA